MLTNLEVEALYLLMTNTSKWTPIGAIIMMKVYGRHIATVDHPDCGHYGLTCLISCTHLISYKIRTLRQQIDSLPFHANRSV